MIGILMSTRPRIVVTTALLVTSYTVWMLLPDGALGIGHQTLTWGPLLLWAFVLLVRDRWDDASPDGDDE